MSPGLSISKKGLQWQWLFGMIRSAPLPMPMFNQPDMSAVVCMSVQQQIQGFCLAESSHVHSAVCDPLALNYHLMETVHAAQQPSSMYCSDCMGSTHQEVCITIQTGNGQADHLMGKLHLSSILINGVTVCHNYSSGL